jgi:hypothetical protein
MDAQRNIPTGIPNEGSVSETGDRTTHLPGPYCPPPTLSRLLPLLRSAMSDAESLLCVLCFDPSLLIHSSAHLLVLSAALLILLSVCVSLLATAHTKLVAQR